MLDSVYHCLNSTVGKSLDLFELTHFLVFKMNVTIHALLVLQSCHNLGKGEILEGKPVA